MRHEHCWITHWTWLTITDRLKYVVVFPGAETAHCISDITNHGVPSVLHENITLCSVTEGAVNDRYRCFLAWLTNWQTCANFGGTMSEKTITNYVKNQQQPDFIWIWRARPLMHLHGYLDMINHSWNKIYCRVMYLFYAVSWYASRSN